MSICEIKLKNVSLFLITTNKMSNVTFTYSLSSSDETNMEPFYKSTTSAVKQKFIDVAAKNLAYDGGVIGNAMLQPLDKDTYAEPFVLSKNWGSCPTTPIKKIREYPVSEKVFRVLYRATK